MPLELYEQVKEKIPSHIGVYADDHFIKKAKKQEIKVDKDILLNSMIRSLSREFDYHYKSEDVSKIRQLQYNYQNTITQLKNELKYYKNIYTKLWGGLSREQKKERYGDNWSDILL